MKHLLIVCAVLLSGCGAWSRTIAHYTGSSVDCIEGVKVVQMTSGAFWLPDADGKPIKCK